MTSEDDSWREADHDPRRRRNTIALVAVAAVLCVVGVVFALSALTGDTTVEPAALAPPVAGSEPAAPDPDAEADTETETATPNTGAAGPPLGRDTITFSSPTGNIGCALDPAGARCDLGTYDWEPPEQPESCTLTWGQGVVLTPEGSGYVCAGDSRLGAATVLEYGEVAERGNVRCASEESGVRCEDSSTGHGFEVARATVELF